MPALSFNEGDMMKNKWRESSCSDHEKPTLLPPEETLEKSLRSCSIFSWSCLGKSSGFSLRSLSPTRLLQRTGPWIAGSRSMFSFMLDCWNSSTGQRGDLFTLTPILLRSIFYKLFSQRGRCEVRWWIHSYSSLGEYFVLIGQNWYHV